MVSINDEFPSKYIKSSDLKGTVWRLKISAIDHANFEKGSKPLLMFEGAKKGLVLNKTNAMTIAEVFGDEMDDWIGGEVELYVTKTTYEGRLQDGLRVRVPKQTQTPTSSVKMAPNARDRAMASEPNPPAPLAEELDDEIPF